MQFSTLTTLAIFSLSVYAAPKDDKKDNGGDTTVVNGGNGGVGGNGGDSGDGGFGLLAGGGSGNGGDGGNAGGVSSENYISKMSKDEKKGLLSNLLSDLL